MAKKKDGDIIHFERKLIRVGDSFAVTVPKKWVTTHGHKPGDIFSGMADSILTIGRKRDTPDNGPTKEE